MRHFISSSLVAAAAVVLMAGSASAVSIDLSVSDLTGSTTPGIDLQALEIGDTFEVSISVTSAGTEGIVSIFSFLKYDPSVLTVTGGFTDPSSLGPEGGFTGNSVTILGAPAISFGQPLGTADAIAFGISNPDTGDGLYRGPGNNGLAGVTPAIAIFEVVGLSTNPLGAIQISQELLAADLEAGVSLDITSAIGGLATVLPVPEPGTALLMGLGLGGLAFSGRRRA